MPSSRAFLLLFLLLLALPVAAEDWSRFRGPNGSGTSSSTGLPAEFGPDKNKIWEAEVPFGRSSPVIAGDRIFVSAIEDGQLVTVALDRNSGETLWRSNLKRSRVDEYHHDTDSATTTPVTDGSNVYVFFQEFGLVSFDKKGKERWRLELGPFRNFYGIDASPLLAGDTLIMLCDQAEGSFLVAVNKDNGKQLWRRNRPARLESWTTPILYPATGKPKSVIVSGSQWVDAYDLATGKNRWALGDVGGGPVSSPVLVNDMLFVNAPNHGEQGWPPFEGILEEHDKDGNGELSREEVEDAWLAKHYGWLDTDADDVISVKDWNTLGELVASDNWGVYAIRLPDGEGEPKVVWNYRKNVAEISSPVVHDGVFYMVHDGIVTSLDAKTGELLKRGRLGEGSPKVYASPVAADGKIYIGTLDGTMVVLDAGGEWGTLMSIDFGDEIWASPAIADGNLYVRTRGKLYRFGASRS
jgi:outer membrane protein assembly factor BamB